MRDPIGFLEKSARSYGDCFTVTIPTVGRVVVVAHPAAARSVLAGAPEVFRAGEATTRLLPFFDPHTVLGSDGQLHHHLRHRLLPLFRTERLAASREWISAIADEEVDSWPLHERFALMPRMRRITFRVIARLALGVCDDARIEELQTLLARMLTAAAGDVMWRALLGSGRGSGATRRLFQRRRAAVDALLLAEIARRRQAPGAWTTADALGLLLDDEDGAAPLEDGEIADELRALLVVGHETTASAMAWAIDLLLRHPLVLRRLQDEIAAGDDAYLDAVIHETLRLRAPVIDAVRLLAEPVQLCTSQLPAGTIVAVAPHLVHHRSDLFSAPHCFRPERFLDGHPAPLTWIPFGGGARRCLGAPLAIWEMKVVLPIVLQRATLHPWAAEPERARLQGTMVVPARGAEVVMTSRRPAMSHDRAPTKMGPTVDGERSATAEDGLTQPLDWGETTCGAR